MIDVFYLGAYWWQRKEELSTIVNKTIAFLKELSALDEEFKDWYEQGYNKSEASKKVLFEASNIEKLYKRGINKKDLDDKGFSKIGFSIGLWTGHKEEYSSSISINSGHASKFFPNACVITLPIAEDAKERLLKLSVQKEIINLMVKNWNPDSLVLNSQELKNETGLINQIGWITYIKNLSYHSKISDKIVHEKFNSGDLFYLNVKDDKSYSYELSKELITLKALL